MPKEIDISTIEQYLSGGMPEQDASEFEQSMQEDEDLRMEVIAYQRLFTGFKALQEETFVNQLGQWNKEWEEIDQEEITLIEAYHQGTLNSTLHQQIETRIAHDDSFAQKVKAYQDLFSGFEGLQSESFSHKLKGWASSSEGVAEKQQTEAKVRSLRPIFTRIAIAASFLLLLGLGINWYANNNYSSEQLIANYYKVPSNSNTMGENPQQANQINTLFEKAHQLLQNGAYDEAFVTFTQLEPLIAKIEEDPFTKAYYENNIEWNKALSALAGNKTEKETLRLLEQIRNNPEQEYQQEAISLINQLESIWRNLAK